MTTRMRSRVAVLVGAASFGLLCPSAALAFIEAKVTLTGSDFTNTGVGGIGTPVATYSDSGKTVFAFHSTTSGGSLTVDTTLGEQEGSISAGIEDFAAVSPRLTGFAGFTLEQQDRFTITCPGLSTGDPVKVRVQVRATGNLSLGGNPSGLSGIGFFVSGVPGIAGSWVDWGTGNLNPPQDLDIDEYWEVQADSTVDDSFQLRARSNGGLNPTSYEGNGTNTLDFAAIVRVSPGDGFEQCTITSEAGAPTTPLPPKIPALPPLALALLAAALIGSGAVAAARTSRRAT
jgi:hypothetical protein